MTAANKSKMGEKCGKMTKNFLNPQKFPQTASERLDLFSCLAGTDFGNLDIGNKSSCPILS